MLLVVGSGIGLGILQHRLQSQLIVDALQPLDVGIGYDDLCIRAALRPAVAVAAAGIGQIALPLVDVQQRVHDVGLAPFVEQGDQRCRGAIGVPDGVVVVVIGRFRPLGILA